MVGCWYSFAQFDSTRSPLLRIDALPLPPSRNFFFPTCVPPPFLILRFSPIRCDIKTLSQPLWLALLSQYAPFSSRDASSGRSFSPLLLSFQIKDLSSPASSLSLRYTPLGKHRPGTSWFPLHTIFPLYLTPPCIFAKFQALPVYTTRRPLYAPLPPPPKSLSLFVLLVEKGPFWTQAHLRIVQHSLPRSAFPGFFSVKLYPSHPTLPRLAMDVNVCARPFGIPAVSLLF